MSDPGDGARMQAPEPVGGLEAAMGRASTRLRSPVARTIALTVALAAVAMVLALGPVAALPDPIGRGHALWWELALAYAMCETFCFSVELRRGEHHAFALSDVVLVVGLLYASPGALVLGRLLAGLVVMVREHRAPIIKGAFNMALFALEPSVALIVFHAVGRGSSVGQIRTWLAASAAVLAVAALDQICVGAVIRWNGGELPSALVLQAAVGVSVANISLALIGAMLVHQNVEALGLLSVLAGVVLFAYRSYARLTQRYAGVQLLYEFTKMVAGNPNADTVVQQVLVQARDLLKAEIGEVVVLEGEDVSEPIRIRAVIDEEPSLESGPLDPLVSGVIRTGAPVLIPRTTKTPAQRAFLEAHGFRDALVTRLMGEGQPIGALVVADRAGAVGTFESADLRLLETLSNHASVALANGRLVERLRQEAREREHQALHDPLTELPNRMMFNRQLDRLVAPDTAGAVLLLDLDRFKEINDTLGHHWGDRLLQEVARRLASGAPDRSIVARLSGDEFAMVLPEIGAADDALAVARSLRRELTRPAHIDGMVLDVAGSIGVATYPAHGQSRSELMKAADVAMYAAKGTDDGVAVYRPEVDPNNRQRLVLAADLRRAIESSDLEVWFQPKADVISERVIGAEALVRWRHPVRGMIGPDHFIPMAEQTGLIGRLTEIVVRHAVHQCRRWRSDGLEMTVAVNIAARTLLDTGLPDSLRSVLQAAGLPPEALTLEITESGIMSDPSRMLGVLRELTDFGIRLSIDDFGTGYSSMSYLQRLPVHEVKVDRSFVAGMAQHPGDHAIVRSVIELSHSLGKVTVAEGVESRDVWDMLADTDCDVAQGYFLSKPLPSPEFRAWLRARAVTQPGRV